MMLCGNIPIRTSSSSHLPYYSAQTPTTTTTTAATTTKPKVTKAQALAAARTAAAKSKSKLWGPSHSFDSDDLSEEEQTLGVKGGFYSHVQQGAANQASWWETAQKALTELGTVVRNTTDFAAPPPPSTMRRSRTGRSSLGSHNLTAPRTMEVVKEEDEEEESTDPSTQEDDDVHNVHNANANNTSLNKSYVDDVNNTSMLTTAQGLNTSRDTATTAPSSRNTSRDTSPDTSIHDQQTNSNNNSVNAKVSHSTHQDPNTSSHKEEHWTDLFSNPCGASSPYCASSDLHLQDLFAAPQCSSKNTKNKNKPPRHPLAKNRSVSSVRGCGLGIAPLHFDFDYCDEEEQEPEDEEDDSFTTESEQTPRNPKSRSFPRQTTSTSTALQRTLSEESPADRRRQRALKRQQRHEQAAAKLKKAATSPPPPPPLVPHEDFEVTSQRDVLITQPSTTALLQQQSQLLPPNANNGATTTEDDEKNPVLQFPPAPPLPIDTLLVKQDEAAALERSISELTMRSSYQDFSQRLPTGNNNNSNNNNNNGNGNQQAPLQEPQQRRMAYYAVGRHHRLSGPRSGGNRRCYFTGKLIFGGAPFYAGIVQQGLRTLVVFCLPSALGMPQNLPNYSPPPNKKLDRGGLLQRSRRTLSSANTSMASKSIALSKSPSRLSSTINIDDMSLSIEGDIDPNWNMDKDYLLGILPEPSDDLLAEMNQRYPEQFETLPVQVRHARCWRLFVKFCFFSGLPIAEGELHYQVRPSLALELYGEEIVLSHDVMEAANGASSAEILKLPNIKTFRYLKKNYQQQSAKLPEIVFSRTSWEQVKPEI